MRMVKLVLLLLCSLSSINADAFWDSMLKYSMYALATNCDTFTEGLQTWTCAWCEYIPIPPVTDITIFDTQGAGLEATFGYVGRTNESIIVAFRGTKTLDNWIKNLEFKQINYTQVDGALVHEGFYTAYLQVADTILPIVQKFQQEYPSLSVISTGHSLGGALSVYNAAALVEAGIKNVEIWNFGQPRTGNLVFSTYINKIIGTIYRVVNEHDLVPHLPPPEVKGYSYHHEATEIWFPTNHTTYIVCDSSGEDPKCSDSVPTVEYSIQEHMDYLGYGQNGLHPVNSC